MNTPAQDERRAGPKPGGASGVTDGPRLPQALIFDVDGTLADTEDAHRCSFNQTFEHFGLGWHWDRDTYRRLLAVTGGKERIAAYLATLPLSADEQRELHVQIPQWHADKTRRYAAMVVGGEVPLRNGVAQLLYDARRAGVRLGIATTTTHANVEALLTAHLGADGLRMFEVVACGDQVRAKKPAPDIYELALRTLAIDASQAIAFEDSVAGLRSAVAAGLWTVVTPCCWTEGGDFSAAGIVLDDLAPRTPEEPVLRTLARCWSDARPMEAQENRGSTPSRPISLEQA